MPFLSDIQIFFIESPPPPPKKKKKKKKKIKEQKIMFEKLCLYTPAVNK